MRLSLPIIFLAILWPTFAFSQPEYVKMDARADTFGLAMTEPAELARQLTAPFQTEKAKARVIFSWVAKHIRYDCEKFRRPGKPVQFTGATAEEIQQKSEQWEANQIRQTLRKKKGVCEDYSRLFKALCEAAGLEAVVITGWGRPFYQPFSKLSKKPNHAWNAVKIDGQWRLADVTWAAGYTDRPVKKFTAYFQPGYFLTPPERFVEDHLPLEEKWQLTPCLVSREEFMRRAYSNSAQTAFPVRDYWPKDGRLIPVDRQMEICIRLDSVPPALVVVSNNSKALDAKQTIEDDFIVLRFKKPARGEVGVYGGEKKGKKEWLLRYTY